jgi:hypothetical protein
VYFDIDDGMNPISDECRGLARIIRLRMWDDSGMGSKAFEYLVRSPHWSNLRTLNFDECPVKTPGKWLPKANMPKLNAMDIKNGIDDDAAPQQFRQSRPEVELPMKNATFGFGWVRSIGNTMETSS